jgi:hypothetical protein
MSLSTQPPVSPGEDLDGLLRAFYQAQLPHPWPDFKAPAAGGAPSARLRRFARLRSRLALAASVAILIAGSFILSGNGFRDTEKEQFLGNRPTEAMKERLKIEVSTSLEVSNNAPPAIKVNVTDVTELPPGK